MSNERWLVSYADFMTLMFAVFVMLWSTSTIDASKYRGIGDALAELSADYDEKMFRRGDSPQQQMKHIAEGLVKILVEIDKGELITVKYDSNKVRVMLSADLAFSSARAVLLEEAKPVLKLVFEELMKSDFINSPEMFLDIVGHTDNNPINSVLYPSNWELSAARAASVARFATSDFPIRTKIRVIGYADTDPIALNDSTIGRAKNRRVELMLFFIPKAVKLSSDDTDEPSKVADSYDLAESATKNVEAMVEVEVEPQADTAQPLKSEAEINVTASAEQ